MADPLITFKEATNQQSREDKKLLEMGRAVPGINDFRIRGKTANYEEKRTELSGVTQTHITSPTLTVLRAEVYNNTYNNT